MSKLLNEQNSRPIAPRCTLDSTWADSQDSWRAVYQSLESIGVTGSVYEQNRDLILQWLRNAIQQGKIKLEVESDERVDITCQSRLQDGAVDSRTAAMSSRETHGGGSQDAGHLPRQRSPIEIPILAERLNSIPKHFLLVAGSPSTVPSRHYGFLRISQAAITAAARRKKPFELWRGERRVPRKGRSIDQSNRFIELLDPLT